MNEFRRVAFFPDTFHEINGVAHTSRHFEQFVRRRQIPFLSVRPGPNPGRTIDGVVTILELKRSGLSFGLDANLEADPLVLRHVPTVMREMQRLGIELIHITGPGDVGLLGCYIAWRLKLPIVMGWHTNLHEYAAKRVERLLHAKPGSTRERMAASVGNLSMDILTHLYSHARIILAPNQELVDFIGQRAKRPAYIMARGVDTQLFTPERRDRTGGPFRIGYVGRLTAEKNVRFLAELGQRLKTAAQRDFEFYIVGQGRDRDWLQANVPNATLPGVLRGEPLAKAYANMDLFAFPSHTDTFGNVVLEALASGVPCVVTASGGPKFLVQSGVTGYVASDDQNFIRCVTSLLNDLDTHHQMKQAARHYACGLSWDSVFEKVFRAYDQCLAPGNVRTKAKAETAFV